MCYGELLAKDTLWCLSYSRVAPLWILLVFYWEIRCWWLTCWLSWMWSGHSWLKIFLASLAMESRNRFTADRLRSPMGWRYKESRKRTWFQKLQVTFMKEMWVCFNTEWFCVCPWNDCAHKHNQNNKQTGKKQFNKFGERRQTQSGRIAS